MPRVRALLRIDDAPAAFTSAPFGWQTLQLPVLLYIVEPAACDGVSAAAGALDKVAASNHSRPANRDGPPDPPQTKRGNLCNRLPIHIETGSKKAMATPLWLNA
jgi:hypothetical protein